MCVCVWVCVHVCVCGCVCMCEYVCVCVCVCVCGCPGGLTGEVCAHNPEDTGSDPRAGGKFLYKKYLQPISSPICKTGTWSCTGEQSALAVSRYSLIVLVGLQGAHTCSERHIQSVLLRAPCPGSRSLHSTGTLYLLSAQVPWLDQERVTYQGSERLFAFVCVCVCVCVPWWFN